MTMVFLSHASEDKPFVQQVAADLEANGVKIWIDEPTMHAFRFFVDAGGLISYGATQSEIYTIAAEQVAKILEGAQPSELPLRQATRFELVINNRTAKALGLTMPPSLLLRADEVLE